MFFFHWFHFCWMMMMIIIIMKQQKLRHSKKNEIIFFSSSICYQRRLYVHIFDSNWIAFLFLSFIFSLVLQQRCWWLISIFLILCVFNFSIKFARPPHGLLGDLILFCFRLQQNPTNIAFPFPISTTCLLIFFVCVLKLFFYFLSNFFFCK